MLIRFVELQNFRKLKSIRIDFDEQQTLLVGANNSGKTSAMLALGHFLVDPDRFTTHDLTLSNWQKIDAIGKGWEAAAGTTTATPPTLSEWEPVLPSLDLWIKVEPDEIHLARHLIPTLDWTDDLLGVRLRYEPKDVASLERDYIAAFKAADDTKRSDTADKPYDVTLWPHCLRSYLDRRLNSAFCRRAYLLDPSKREQPINGIARPQTLPAGEPTDVYPLDGLIRIDEISAQRGLGESSASTGDPDGGESAVRNVKKHLSSQLRSYYDKHLDPTEFPEVNDLKALQAIEAAERAYDERLAEGFKNALEELRLVNYPGISDPVLRIATRLRPTDGLSHSSAVQYEVAPSFDGSSIPLSLPEEFNGLGYQNLISMVFKLMSFRDAWMRVGKASKASNATHFHPPLHLVIVEEPEAHLHVQVQQVFVRQAYAVLRNHPAIGEKTALRTQLIVSTHSSHVAHECSFACLRYFRRMPTSDATKVPTAAVVNLSEVFGTVDDTARFVERYLRATHCDLFFADAAILVEGPAERMLVPHFIEKHFPELHRCYVTLLEIGGSHAHTLKPLVESLGLTTLVITDIDAAEATGKHKVVPPERKKELISRNTTLAKWHPCESSLDKLLDLTFDKKLKPSTIPQFSVRIAYQSPVKANLAATGPEVELLATTFEDALVLENIEFFRTTTVVGVASEFKEAIATSTTPAALGSAMFDIVRSCDKARFALDLLWLKDPDKLKVPMYIREGLEWLQMTLDRKNEKEVLASVPAATAGGAA